jgi:hypothetical protein
MKATLVILIVVAACGGSSVVANTALKPAGQGWFCTGGTEDPVYFSYCSRETEKCQQRAAGGAPGAFRACAPAATAHCYTFNMKRGATLEPQVECFDSAAACSLRRAKTASREIIHKDISGCVVWD